MVYYHVNASALVLFQVSAAGTCIGCLLVALSFLAKVWFCYSHCILEECQQLAILLRLNKDSLCVTGTELGKRHQHSVRFGRHPGTYCS
jgi:hypothetical protein